MIEMHLKRGKIFSTLVVVTLIIAVLTNVFIIGPVMVPIVGAADDSDSYYNDTTLNVTVLQLEPRINWYDLQNSSGVSVLNGQLDVNENCYFKINISSDQGWPDIEYIWINAWYDNGSDSTIYNQTGSKGGNINLNITYDNSTETASAFMPWPTNGSEATFIGWSEVNKTGTDPGGSPGYTHTYNLTFIWKPSYQFRYAPDPSDPAAGFNDTWSWNFNITVLDDDGHYSYNNPTVGETINEFGVYSYTEIVSAGWPVVVGSPGDEWPNYAQNTTDIEIEHRSNGNYSLAVDVDNLTHKQTGSYWIDNTSILTKGGELLTFTNFSGTGPHYYYNKSGASPYYTLAEDDNVSKITDDIWWAVSIPYGQYPGDYNATIYYHLKTQTG